MATSIQRAFDSIGPQNSSQLTCEENAAQLVELLGDATKALENSASAIDEALSTSDQPIPHDQVLRLKGVLRQTRATLNKLKGDAATN